jgi:Domain of unknown function (DUF6457)
MNAKAWLAEFAERLGTTPPEPGEFAAILELAGEAAHASERVAAPAAAWLAAKAGCPPDEALAKAKGIGAGG